MKQQKILKNLITALTTSNNYHSLLVIGKAGIGKTTTTLNTLKELNLKEGQHYIYWNNYITGLEFYKLLMNTNELENPKLLVLDDIEETLKNQRILGLLKGALWQAGGRRQVSWLSGTSKIKESHFNFQGKIIFILNYLQLQNHFIKALIDRSFFFEMKISKPELLEMMKNEIKKPQYQLSQKQKAKLIEYLEGIDEERLSLRTLQQLYNIYLLSPSHWQEIANKIYIKGHKNQTIKNYERKSAPNQKNQLW